MKAKVIQKYNALDGCKRIMRATIERLKKDAKNVHPTIYKKLSGLLKNNPEDNTFDITIANKISLKSKKNAVSVKKPTVKIPKTKVDKNGQFGLFGADGRLNISTAEFEKMSITELRNFTKQYYKEHLKGKKVAIKNSLKSVEFVGNVKEKLHKPMYSAKASVIKHLETLVKNSTYNNFGKPKPTDTKDVLGYLNFKAKLFINKENKHVRISIVLYKDRSTKLKSYDVGKEKSRKSNEVLSISKTPDGMNILLSNNKTTKNKPNNKGLKAPTSKNTLNNRFSATKKRTFFKLQPKFKDMNRFLGKVEVLEKESAVMTLSAGQGAGKTTAFFDMMNAFASSGYKCLHASLEEHPESYLYEKKVTDLLNKEALPNITAPNYGRNNIKQLWNDINDADVIFIDSMKKLWQYQKGVDLDNDLRKKYNGKLFVIIFQLTSTGKMRGGSDAQFDGDIISFIEKHDDFNENYIYHDKNRYATENIANLKYNISSKKLQGLPTTGLNGLDYVIVG